MKNELSIVSRRTSSLFLMFENQNFSPKCSFTTFLIWPICSFLTLWKIGHLVIICKRSSSSRWHSWHKLLDSCFLNLLLCFWSIYTPVSILALTMAFLTSNVDGCTELQTIWNLRISQCWILHNPSDDFWSRSCWSRTVQNELTAWFANFFHWYFVGGLSKSCCIEGNWYISKMCMILAKKLRSLQSVTKLCLSASLCRVSLLLFAMP